MALDRPPHVNEYSYIDAVALILGHMVSHFSRLTLEETATEVRKHWRGWLDALTKTERATGGCPQNYFCVAWISLKPRKYLTAVGSIDEISVLINQVISEIPALNIPMTFPLNALKANAGMARPPITLPDKLTVAPDEPGYEEWQADIKHWRAAGGIRADRKRLVKA